MGEQNDLSSEYPERLKKMVGHTKAWSEEHLQPLWFYNDKTEDEWKADSMPYFDRTFRIIGVKEQ